MSGWGCPHDDKGRCGLLKVPCDPGLKGCVLYGKFVFSDPSTPGNEGVRRREERREKRSRDES